MAGLRDRDWTDDTADLVRRLPHYDACDAAMYRQRSKMIPALPKTREEINLQGPWRETTTGENFIISDDNMLMFSTDANLRHLSNADTWFCDGTFKSCPKLFKQIYTVHAQVDGEMFPLAYTLLPDKKQTTYETCSPH